MLVSYFEIDIWVMGIVSLLPWYLINKTTHKRKDKSIAMHIIWRRQKKVQPNYIDSDYTKMVFTDECDFKGGKQACRRLCTDEEKYIISTVKPKWKVNAWVPFGLIEKE